MYRIVLVLVSTLLVGMGFVGAQQLAVAPGNEHFQRTWELTDRPVLEGVVARTWMWAPEAFTGSITEEYLDSPDDTREVQYFDKARMEITHPDTGDPNSIWYVTNGLLVVEMITGNLQLGDATFEQHTAAVVNVAGDADDPDGPTYATFGSLLDASPAEIESIVTQRLDRNGSVTVDPELASQDVRIGTVDDVTEHAIAAPFWQFMTSTGTVYADGQFVEDLLFENPYFATGRPISEAYWAAVKVAGTRRDVLMQCFERRCLTYTPGNPEGFVVEAGNVGQHYYRWRYEDGAGTPEPSPEPTVPTSTITPMPSPTATLGPTLSPSPTATEPPDAGVPSEGSVQYESTLGDWPFWFWETGAGGAPAADPEGYLIVSPPGSDSFLFDTNPGEFGDASYELQVLSWDDSGDVSGCLAIRATDDGSYLHCVEFSSGAAYRALAFYLDFSSGDLVELNSFDFDPPQTASKFHSVKIIALSSQYWFYANGKFVGTVSYGAGQRGHIGIGTVCTDRSDWCAVGFRNLVVRSVTTSQTTGPASGPAETESAEVRPFFGCYREHSMDSWSCTSEISSDVTRP